MERSTHNRKVAGSNPAPGIRKGGLMEKYEKRIGYALLLIGVIFGIEGILAAFSGLWISNIAGQVMADTAQEAMLFEGAAGMQGILQTVQAIFAIVAVYGVAKTIIGIFCIAFGMKVAFKKR